MISRYQGRAAEFVHLDFKCVDVEVRAEVSNGSVRPAATKPETVGFEARRTMHSSGESLHFLICHCCGIVFAATD